MSFFKPDPRDESWLLWMTLIMSAGLALFLPIAIVFGFQHYQLQNASKDWPKAQMTVTSAKEGFGKSVSLEFEFDVNGVTHKSSNDAPESADLPSELESLLQKYAVGTKHNIYYKPDDPGSYTVFEPGGNSLWLLIGTILAIPATLGLIFNAVNHYRVISLKSKSTN